MMKIYITGISGFIGKNIANKLIDLGYEVGGLTRQLHVQKLNSLCRVFNYDSTYDSLEQSIKLFQPNIVINLAAIYVNEHKPADIHKLIESNITFSNYLYEAMSLNGVRNIIQTGTSWEFYQNIDGEPVNLYAATKRCSDVLLRYYISAKNFRAINLKLFDTYGPGDDRKKLFYLLRQASKNSEEVKISPGNQLIDLVYIDDLVDAYIKAIDLFKKTTLVNSTYGVGTNQRRTLREIIDIYQEATCRKILVKYGAIDYRPREVMIPWTNFEKIPGWAPKVNLLDGIKMMEQRKKTNEDS
jgi:nucleoside-diphosphate-sugar epimerase